MVKEVLMDYLQNSQYATKGEGAEFWVLVGFIAFVVLSLRLLL